MLSKWCLMSIMLIGCLFDVLYGIDSVGLLVMLNVVVLWRLLSVVVSMLLMLLLIGIGIVFIVVVGSISMLKCFSVVV